MKTFNKLLIAATLSTLSSVASAIPFIEGSLGFSGAYDHDGTSDLSDATTFSNFTGVFVTGTTSGTFLTEGVVAPAPATYSDFTFNPTTVPVLNLWTVADGDGDLFSFDLTSMNLISQTGTAVELSGSGTVTHADYAVTDGTWIFTANNLGLNFSFSSSAVAAPEPALALLLGAGLLGFGVTRRMRK